MQSHYHCIWTFISVTQIAPFIVSSLASSDFSHRIAPSVLFPSHWKSMGDPYQEKGAIKAKSSGMRRRDAWRRDAVLATCLSRLVSISGAPFDQTIALDDADISDDSGDVLGSGEQGRPVCRVSTLLINWSIPLSAAVSTLGPDSFR